ncbi:MAG: hypothetical protein IPQ07_20950 [Myxococcales bacterium]|nr:hypothetical protein [Myxococcales bacterium]
MAVLNPRFATATALASVFTVPVALALLLGLGGCCHPDLPRLHRDVLGAPGTAPAARSAALMASARRAGSPVPAAGARSTPGSTPRAVVLHVQVMGTGRVDVTGASSCGGNGPSDCMITVPKGPVTLHAVATDGDKPFDRWTTPNCTGQTSTCMFSANTSTTVGAKFK